MLQADGVTVRRGGNLVIDDVSLRLPVGLTGLLGPNGAGKTTLMTVLAGLRRPARGSLTFAGERLSDQPDGGELAYFSKVGYLPQRFRLMGLKSCRDNVMYAAWARGVPKNMLAERTASVLAIVDLADRTDVRARALSGGMRQRLGIACALAHDPSVLLLDEPTVGLDPAQRASLRALLGEIAETRTVLLSTHILEDLTPIAQRLVVLDHGKVRFAGQTGELSPHEGGTQGLETAYLRLIGG